MRKSDELRVNYKAREGHWLIEGPPFRGEGGAVREQGRHCCRWSCHDTDE